MAEQQKNTRTGFAALVGRPNVGKSTLLNALLGQKVAIVSHRPQTTRNRILGVKTEGLSQVVLLDTPGIHRRRANINRFMVREAFETLEGLDCAVLVTEVDPKRLSAAGDAALHPEDAYVLEQVRARNSDVPVVLVINKIDMLRDRKLLLPLMAQWQESGFSSIVPLSALERDGVDVIFAEICKHLPEAPFLYPEDMLTDRAERFLAAELIREQVFRQCREEVPYATAVEILSFDERSGRTDVRIEATIHLERESQKAIVVGAKGARIKEIGTIARAEIGKLLDCTVHLNLTVRVSPDWSRTTAGRRRFGYE